MEKAAIRDYRDLIVWQKAIELAVICDEICDALPPNTSHLTSQIRRAANSVHANIAEGNGRFSRPDYLRHLSIANGSLRELESDLHFVARRFGSNQRVEEGLRLTLVVVKLLAGLRRSLRTSRS